MTLALFPFWYGVTPSSVCQHMNAFTHFQISCALRRITVLQASIQLIVLSIRASNTVRCVYILRLMLHAAKREATKRFLRRTFHIFSKYMEVILVRSTLCYRGSARDSVLF